jgi:hypothetical protein
MLFILGKDKKNIHLYPNTIGITTERPPVVVATKDHALLKGH